MPLANYSDLKNTLPTYLGRQDLTLTIPDLIVLAESRLNRVLPLRMMRTDALLTGTFNSRQLTLPADFVEPIALFLTTFGVQTKLAPLVTGQELSLVQGVPSRWRVNQDQIDLNVLCDQAHTFSFRYRKSFVLNDATPTNWLMTNHPDAYIAASLVEAGLLTEDTDLIALWQQRLDQITDEIKWKDARSTSIGNLMVDPMLQTPAPFNINTG